MGEAFRNMVANIMEEIRSWFRIKFESKYDYYWKSSRPNITIESVMVDSMSELYERHSYIQYAMRFVEQLVHCYVFTVFALIFIP